MRFLRGLVGILLVLAVIGGIALVASDKALRASAQDAAAASLEREVPFTDRPGVTIDGYPFAWYALVGFPSVRVTASGMPVTAQNQSITLQRPSFTLTGVRASASAITARSLDGSVLLSYADLGRLTGGKVSLADGGRVRYTASARVLDVDVDAVVSGLPSVDVAQQTFTFTDVRVSVAGVSLPALVTEELRRTLVQPIALPLEYGLRMTAASATASGLEFRLGGTDVTLPLAR